MAAVLRQDIDFHGLFRKLGHNLEEIRVRALENILSKLEHKLVCDADIINERHLFIRLLEWFNFSTCSKAAEVLGLLSRLSQHSAAAEIIQDIGGVDFLTQYREHASPGLRPVIDQILEHTMRLPEVKVTNHAPECIYHKPVDTVLSQTATSIDDSTQTYQFSAILTPGNNETASIPNADRLACYGDPATGYFTSLQEEEIGPPLTRYEPGGSAGLRVTVFPWLPLTPTDRHVLQSTSSSLRSKDIALLTSACEFLSDVVLQDFPAEIFLQRPQIVKSLWSLLGLKSDDKMQLLMSAVQTLTDVTRCLHTRLKYYQDPVLYTPKHDFSSSSSSTFSPVGSSSSSQSARSSDSRPSVVGWTAARHRGDGRDGDSSSASERSVSGASSLGMAEGEIREETDADDSHALQYHQITLPQFCVISLQKTLPLLHTSSESVAVGVLQLLQNLLDLSVQVITTHVWSETSQPSREVVEKLSECLTTVGDLLSFHHHSHHLKPDGKHGSVSGHRLVYISLCNYLVQFLCLVPATSVSTILPHQLVSMLTMAVFDESLSLAYPSTHSVLVRLVQAVDLETFNTYKAAMNVCKAMTQACRFMTAFKQGIMSPEELSIMMEEGIASLPYHLHLPLVTSFIKFFSNISYKASTEKSTITRCSKCFLQLLSYPLQDVRKHVYKAILSTVQSSLNVNQAADPKSRTCLRVKFLLNHEVLYQIVCFGLADTEKEISGMAAELMLILLQGQLLMTDSLWQEFTTAISKSQSILQSYADSSTVLGRRIKTMVDPTSTADNLPLLEKFRGILRLMFSADAKLRAESLRQLAWFLTNETNSDNKIPTFSELDVSKLANVFIMETTKTLDSNPGRSVFQVGDLQQVYGIFNSKPVDPGVKKSAVDQLAIMLQDPNLHTAFRQEGGLESILDLLRTGVEKQPHEGLQEPNQLVTYHLPTEYHSDDFATLHALQTRGHQRVHIYFQNPNIPYLPSCATIIRHLLHYDYTLRHNLAHDSEIYYCLVRVSLMFQKDEKVCYNISHILTLLLHDEIAKFDLSTSKGNKLGMAFTLPSVMTKRYRLPFRPPIHHETSPNQPSVPPEEDPLLAGPPLEKLRLAWNVAWNGGLEELLSLMRINSQMADVGEEFSPRLHLSLVEKQVLEITEFKWGFQQGVFAISNAVSHGAVEDAVVRLSAYLLNVPSLHSADLLPARDWFSAMDKFLQVMPTSPPDQQLLLEVLKFINILLRLPNRVSADILPWLADKLYDVTGPLIGLLHKSGGVEHSDEAGGGIPCMKRSVDKQLLRFIITFSGRLPYQLCMSLKMHQMRGDLAKKLLLRLNVTDAPQFYNLASLEGTLQCLVHVTARPGWSQECTDVDSSSLGLQVLSCLLEVVSAFHIGRGSTSMSYMGKGVTKAATLCLRHLAYEMSTLTGNKDWPRNWIYSRRGAETRGEPGLNWLLTLWAYRDPEVRGAGLGIAVALSSTEMGRIIITANCKHIPGGIWGAAFSVLLDQSECSMVRQQAALLLVNLTSQTMPSGGMDGVPTTWQGPVVMDTEYEVSLVGLAALLALLHHSQFYQDMLLLLNNLYYSSTVQPVTVTMETQLLSAGSMESSDNTSASGQHLGMPCSMRHQRSLRTPTTSASSGTPRSGYEVHGDVTSSSSADSSETVEYQSVVTPCLVAAVCRFLKNLVILAPQDTFMSLKKDNYIANLISMIDSSQIQEYCQEMSSGSNPSQAELAFLDLIQMYDSVVTLLRACVLYDSPIRVELLENMTGLESIVSLLLIDCNGGTDLSVECTKLWTSVFKLLSALIQLQSSSALDVVTQAMSKAWIHLTDMFGKVIEMLCKETESVSEACLGLLSLLFCEEGKIAARHPEKASRTLTLSELLDVQIGKVSENSSQSPRTTGASLCKALISTYDLLMVKHSDRVQSTDCLAVVNTLKSLLVISQSAKQTALDMGLAETLLVHLKQLHGKLNLESLQLAKPGRKEDPLLLELVVLFSLLRNFMAQNEDVKLACHHSGLASLLHRLWAWALMDTRLMAAMLSLLMTFTAHCPTAASSLAYTTSSLVVNTSPDGKPCLSSSSLVHCLLKLVGAPNTNKELTKMVFSILATLTLSSECRSIMWKSNFFSEFSKLNPQKSQKAKWRSPVDVQWLEVLVNLSFSVEGHQIILKIKGSMELLLDYLELGSTRTQELALLMLRNLCCHGSNKLRLLSNEKLIPALLCYVKSGTDKNRAMAASAFWALIFNNQKAKVLMKNANIVRDLQETLHNMANLATKSDLQDKCIQDLKAVVTSMID